MEKAAPEPVGMNEEREASPNTADHVGMSTHIDQKQERKVVWKLDTVVLPVILGLQLVSYLDRGNIGFAATQGMTKDIGLKGSELNAAVSVFYVLYIVAEFTSALVVKRIGFGRFIPVVTIAWGLICMSTGFVKSYGGLIATRLLLGGAEGCLFPALSLFLLNYYKREEIATRIAFLFGSAAISGAFGGLIAYGIVHMNGISHLAGWRWLYIIEGLLTIAFGAACFLLIPASFETAYFLNESDKAIMRQRARQATSYSGGDGRYTKRDLRLAFRDGKVYLSGVCQFCSLVVVYGFGTFLPLIIKGIGYTSVTAQQYLTIPVQVWGTLVYYTVAILSDHLTIRFIPLISSVPIVIVAYALLLASAPAGAHYFATFLVATGCYICAGVNFAWLAANSAPDGKRAASVGIQQTMAQVAGIVAGQIYQSADAPKYTLGHAFSLGSIAVAGMGYLLFWLLLRERERQKAELTSKGLVVEDGQEWDDQAADFSYQL